MHMGRHLGVADAQKTYNFWAVTHVHVLCCFFEDHSQLWRTPWYTIER